jgi:hypothetical protein
MHQMPPSYERYLFEIKIILMVHSARLESVHETHAKHQNEDASLRSEKANGTMPLLEKGQSCRPYTTLILKSGIK